MDHQDLQPNKNLYKRIAGGDRVAFATVHQELKMRLLFYCRKLGLEWEDAQEAVSDSFVSLWNSRLQLQSDEHMHKFLYLAARNKAINIIKAKNRYKLLLKHFDAGIHEENPLVNTGIIKAEMLHQLGLAMEQLPKECRRVFELTFRDQRSPAEIAHILDMNPATVRSQKRRALKLIKDWIGKHVPPYAIILPLLSSFKNYF